LNDVVTALDVDNISLVAHSQGCLTALEFASRYPEKLRSVSFIASGLATPVHSALLESAQNRPEAAIAMMMSWGFGSAGHFHQGPIPGSSMIAGGTKVMRGNVPNELSADLKACNAYKNGETAAASINCPRQVILAGKDRMAPRKAGMALVQALAGGQGVPQLDIIEQSGHMVPQEAPNECRYLLKNFIFSINPST
jgi:pimeloyl-ACP methyl ester carboxylesterase